MGQGSTRLLQPHSLRPGHSTVGATAGCSPLATAGDPGRSRPCGCSCRDGGTSKGLSGARCAGKAGQAPTPPLAPKPRGASAPHPPCLICTLLRAAGEVGALALPRTGGLGDPPQLVPRGQAKAGGTCLMVEPGVCKGPMSLNPGGPGRGRAWGWGGQPACRFALTSSIPGRSSAEEAGARWGLSRFLRGPFGAGGSRAGHGEMALAPQQRCKG